MTSKLGKWMPPDSPAVKVDSHPRLSGVMDTINSTLAHGPKTKLPKEFYDQKAMDYIERIAVEEWFAGYKESREYRRLGIGSLVGDITARLVERTRALAGHPMESGQHVRFAMSGCHDTTLAAVLASLGAFEDAKWPPYTSHIAIELLRAKRTSESLPPSQSAGLWHRLFGQAQNLLSGPTKSARTPLAQLSDNEKASFDGYFVRIRFNDAVVRVPGCAPVGKHYGDDESLCSLVAFKEVVDKITPTDWRKECAMRVGESAFPIEIEEAGY